ncbi:MAG: ABC transporter permease [Bacteroidetes bacterium]|nr:ABC transporter permease [Bacteroidota bacterium]
MLKNYLSITLRNLRRHKGYSFINIVGLAAGLAAFVLITLFVQNELSYDRQHGRGADLYRVILSADVMGQSLETTNTPAPMAATLVEEFPEIVNATRLDSYSRVLVEHEDRQFYEPNFFLADSTFFDIFTVPLSTGDPKTALARPNTIVVTEEIARKYFGDEQPLGKILRVDNNVDYEITGIIQPIPGQSHFKPDLVGSFLTSRAANSPVWLNNSWYTYLLLEPGTDPVALEEKFPAIVSKYVAPSIERVTGQSYEEAVKAGLRYEFLLENVRDIYLYSGATDQIGPTGDVQYVYIMSAIALFVLLIAGINFMNLSTARATSRAREVGLRKVMGSDRKRLIYQFLGESLTMAGISMLLAVGFIFLALPLFNSIAGTSLVATPWLFATLLGVTMVTGFVAGLYPAFVLSGFRPVTVLNGSFASTSHGSFLRSSLVVFQFAITISLLIGTGVVIKQLNFIQNRDVGFDKEQVVVLPLESDEGRRGFETFREEIVQFPGVVEASGSNGLPGPGHIHQNTAFRGEANRSEDIFLASLIEVSPEYVTTLGLEILHGRDFSRNITTDVEGFLINEEAARELGFEPEEVVGTMLSQLGGNDDDSNRTGQILGVFADANFESMHQPIRPLVLGMQTGWRYIPVRINADQTAETLAFLEEKWTALEPAYPYRYYFMDEDYRLYYDQEERLGQIYSYFTGLAILIACLGLFGLASFVTMQRTKEIGVRKVLGASVTSVVFLLSRQFTRLVLLSCVVAFPIAYFAMRSWLQDFAYATTIGWEIFVIAGVMSLAIAWLTVGFQSVRAAIADPVKALHHE